MTPQDKAAAIRAALTRRPDPLTTAALLLAMITSPNKANRETAKDEIRRLAQTPGALKPGGLKD